MGNTKVLKYINKYQLTSVMNNTKWKKLIKVLVENQYYEPQVKFKYIDNHFKETDFSHVWWDEIIQNGLEVIEYMEIDTIKKTYMGRLVKEREEDFSKEIEEELRKENIPYFMENKIIKILGYK